MQHPNQKTMKALILYTEKYALKYNHATGVFILKGDEIISKAVTTINKDKDLTSHAELKAISKACRKLKNYHLTGCYLYTTQEPCPMCASAIVWARIKGVVFGREGHTEWGRLNIPCKDILRTSPENIKLYSKFLEQDCLRLKLKRDQQKSYNQR